MTDFIGYSQRDTEDEFPRPHRAFTVADAKLTPSDVRRSKIVQEAHRAGLRKALSEVRSAIAGTIDGPKTYQDESVTLPEVVDSMLAFIEIWREWGSPKNL